MQSVRELVKQEGFNAFPVSFRQVLRKRKVRTALDLVAAHKIADTYRRCCGSASQLGSPRGDLSRRPDGAYFQDFALATLELADAASVPKVKESTQATVQLAAVKCFGTDDPGGTDEPFIVFSIVSVDPFQLTTSAGAVTVRTEIVNDVGGGQVFLDDGRLLTLNPIDVTGTGLHIGVLLGSCVL